MKLIQYINGVVVDILNVRNDATMENIALVDSIPVFEHKEGYNGVLMYNTENGLYWDYIANPVVEETATFEDYQDALGEFGVEV